MSRAFQPHVVTSDSAAGGQIIDGSLKFNIARTNYLKRYVSSDGNKQVWTSSFWIKRTRLGVQQKILEAGSSSSSFVSFEFQADDKLQLYGYADSATQVHLKTESRYRDTSAWYHVVVYMDSVNSTARLYVNGVQPAMETNTQPTTNYNFHINNNVPHSIGRSQTTNNYYLDGYLSQFYHLDGVLRDASHFGYTDEATGIWRPKKYKRRSPNNGTQWRNGVSGNIYSGTTADIFNSNLSAIGINGNGNASNNHLTVASINVRASSVGVRVSNSGSDIQVSINGSVVGTVASGNMTNNIPKLFTFTFDETLISTIKLQRVGSASGWFLYEIQLDDTPLVDNDTSNMGKKGFYLPFDGNSVPTDDQSGNGNNFVAYQMRPSVPLSKATGALPIMRTNKGGSIALTGVRDDPNGSSCVVAVPGHNSFQDYSYHVGASTYKSFTTSGSPTISPEASGHQGGQCLYRNSIKLVKTSSQYIEIPFSSFNLGTGDFTIECWAMHTGHSRDMNLFNLYSGSNRKFFVQARVDNSANDFHARFYGSSNQYNSNSIEWQNNDNALKVWYHVAACRASGTFRIFLNGVLVSAEHNTSGEDLGSVDRLRVGYMESDSDKYWDGFVQDIRFYTTAKYTSNFSVPSGNSNIVADSPSGVAVPRKFDYSVLENGSVSINAASDYLNIANSSDFDLGSSWTIEFWFYPYDTTNAKVLGTRGDSSPRGWEIVYWNGGQIGIEQYGDQTTSGQQRGTKLLAPLAWHHVAITHNGTNTRTYIDGFADLNYTGSSGSNWGSGGHGLRIGKPEAYSEAGRYAISNLRIVKGTVVYTTNFEPTIEPLTNITNTKLLCCNSKTSETSATVTPNTITRNGNVYANDFNPFDVADTIGQESGYCIMNFTHKNTNVTPSDGGLHWSCTAAGDGKTVGTLSFTKGKYYFEDTVAIASRHHVGVVSDENQTFVSGDLGNRADEWVIRTDGYKVNNINGIGGDGVNLNTTTTNLQGYIWMVAVDADNGKIYFGKNGLWLAGANPYTGANAHYTNLSGYELCAGMGRRTGANAANINFGQTPFVYNPPEGFHALCTSNIKHGPVRDPRQHFGALTWTGNGSASHAITGLKFKPDLVWIKCRSSAKWHILVDSIRGNSKNLSSNATNSEYTETHIPSFDNNGITVADIDSGTANENSFTYVAWCWKAGGTAVTNSVGSISSQVSANKESGFSIMTYTGNGSNGATIGHGLDSAPEFVIVKGRTNSLNWVITEKNDHAKYLELNTTQAYQNQSSYNMFNSTAPSSTVITLGNIGNTNSNGVNYVAYAWHSVPGYSKVGAFNGDGETDNTFIPCGFRPAWIMARSVNSVGGQWWIVDTKRDSDNVVYNMLDANRANAERTDTIYDINSNGFKVRLGLNTDTFVFLAFAEQPISNPFGGQSDAR